MTTLSKRLGKVAYFLGYGTIPMLYLFGFGLISGWIFLAYLSLFPLAYVVLVIFGWRKHREELLAEQFARYGINTRPV